MNGYTDTIRRWAIDGRRAGPLENPDGIGEVGLGAEEAGRRLAVRFALLVDGGTITAARFEVFGCGFTIAACAAAADLAEGYTLAEAAAISEQDIDEVLRGLPPEREYCAGLAARALQAAIESASRDRGAVRTAVDPAEEEHGARVHSDDPVYRRLMKTPRPDGTAEEDRHLFACLLSIAAKEPHEPAEGLGLDPEAIDAILATCFPGTDPSLLDIHGSPPSGPPPARNDDVLCILLGYVSRDFNGSPLQISRWLAHILAARAAHPGHLWVSMGLFERFELTAAIRRHLPCLADANSQGMRWKRFLFKRVCEIGGGVVCKTPNCGECSDYALCFESDD